MNTAHSHPDYPVEREKLDETVEFIGEELVKAHEAEKATFEEYDDLFRHSGGNFSNELFVAAASHRRAKNTRMNLERALNVPYFTRVDFHEDRQKDFETHYIGKWGVIDPKTQDSRIVDWRSPIANLYYSGQLGRVSYKAPDGSIEGELKLKRQLGIKQGTLESIFDTEVVSRDVYLQAVLGQRATNKLRDIVSTIQREQNDVIRAPKDKPLIAQGAAGAGKTTIALHRIAYLLYAHRETMASENMLIIAPNPLFLDYISQVLPELGADEVKQTTFEGLCLSLLGTDAPAVVPDDKLQRILEAEPEQADALMAVSRLKGSRAYISACKAWLDKFEREYIPEEDIMFGSLRLYSSEELRSFFLIDLAPFPMKRRLESIRKQIDKRAKEAAQTVAAWLDEECQRRVQRTKAGREDSPQLRARLRKLYEERDERTARAKADVRGFAAGQMKRFPPLSAIGAYKQFIESDAPEGIPAELWEKLQSQTLPLLTKKRAEWEDLAALVLFKAKLTGYAERIDVHHTVIDEAQDFSLFQLTMLRQAAGSASFTLVGDVAQGIHGYRGVESWKESAGAAFQGKEPMYLTLVTSYRSTVQIMEFAGGITRHFPPGEYVPPQPVLRDGEVPRVVGVDERERAGAIHAEAKRFIESGCVTIGIIEQDERRAKRLHEALEEAGLKSTLIAHKDAAYKGGVSVLPAVLSKGLEFDGVIVADAGDECYDFTPLSARLLYVACTRPLHNLTLFYTGEKSKLLE